MNNKQQSVVPAEIIEKRIYFIRGRKVMLDKDLAELYGVTTGNLNKAVKRNISRFPGDFMFKLNKDEYENLRFQSGTTSWGGRRYRPYAFTENGVAMLSGVLNSQKAIDVNIQIMRVFTKLRDMLASHEDLRRKIDEMEKRYDSQFKVVFDVIRKLIEPGPGKVKKIGFK